MQVDAFVFEGSLQAFDEDVVDAFSLSIHGDAGFSPLQPFDPGEGRKLAALVGVHDLRWSETQDGLVECLGTNNHRNQSPPRLFQLA